MKTKHLLTGLVLPALLAACTAEEIVEQQAVIKNDLSTRPVVGNVTLTTGGEESRATLADGSWNTLVFEEGDKIGARIIDVYSKYTETTCDEDDDCSVCENPYWNYKIDNSFASSNYQYIKGGDGKWDTDALMVEGNYMFYFPYNEKFLERGPVKVTLPLSQHVSADNTAQPVKDLYESENPFVVAYNFLPAKDQDYSIGLDFQHLFAYPQITLKNDYVYNEGEDDEAAKAITIDKIIIGTKDAATNKIQAEGVVNHENLVAALNNVLIDKCDNHNEVKAGTWVTLNDEGRVKPGTFKKYTQTATSDDIVDFEGDASYITVDIEDVIIEPGKTFSFNVVMPALQFAKGEIYIKVYLADNKMFKKDFEFNTLNNHITFIPGKRYPEEEYNYNGQTASAKTSAGALATFNLNGEIVDAVLPVKAISTIAEFEAMLDAIKDNTLTLTEGTVDDVNAADATADFALAKDKNGKTLLEINDEVIALLDEYLANGEIEFTSDMVVKASAIDNIHFSNVTFASEDVTVGANVQAKTATIVSGKVSVSDKANETLGTVTVEAGELAIARKEFLENTSVVVSETVVDEKVVATGTLSINAENSLNNVTMNNGEVVVNAAVTQETGRFNKGVVTNNKTIDLEAAWTVDENVTFVNKGVVTGEALKNEGTIKTEKNLDVDTNNGVIVLKSETITVTIENGAGEIDNTINGMVTLNNTGGGTTVASNTNVVYAELDEITSVDALNKMYDDASAVSKIVATGTWTVRDDVDSSLEFKVVEFKGATLTLASATLNMSETDVIISANTTWTGRGVESSIVMVKSLKYNMYDSNSDDENDAYYTLTANKVSVQDANKDAINPSLVALQQAAESGGSVTLTNDVALVSTLNFKKDVTLDLNGKTITNSGATEEVDVVKVTSGTLTINGSGVLEAVNGNDGYTVIADGATAKVVINGGTYKVGHDSNKNGNNGVYTKNGGSVEINGGYFEHTGNVSAGIKGENGETQYTLLNVNGTAGTKGGDIVVKGGTFKNFNPGNNYSEGDGTNFVADGYKVEAYNAETGVEITNGTSGVAYMTTWITQVNYKVVAK